MVATFMASELYLRARQSICDHNYGLAQSYLARAHQTVIGTKMNEERVQLEFELNVVTKALDKMIKVCIDRCEAEFYIAVKDILTPKSEEKNHANHSISVTSK